MGKKLGRASVLGLVCVGLAASCLVGCPGGTKETKLTVLFTGDNEAVQKAILALVDPAGIAAKQGIDIDAIESLTIEITQISMDHAGSVSEEGDGEGEDTGEGEGEGEDTGETEPGSNKVVVFPTADGPQTLVVDVKELIEVSRALSTVDVPSGRYTKIRLSYQNPVLVLVGDTTEYDDIQTTANSRLFISEKFELPEDQSSLIMLDFGGIHVNDTNNDSFTLTPQLRVDLTITSAVITLSGTIAAIDGGAMTISESEGDVELVITAETTAHDEEGTALELTGLMVGDLVTVTATITVDGYDGPITATDIVVPVVPDGDEGAGEGEGEGGS